MRCGDIIDKRFLEEGLSAPSTPSPQWTPAVSTPVNLQRPRTTLEMSTIKGSNSKHTQPRPGGMPTASGAECAHRGSGRGEFTLKQTVGRSCWGVCVRVCLGVCVAAEQSPCTGRALRSISASKFHLKETKTHGSTRGVEVWLTDQRLEQK